MVAVLATAALTLATYLAATPDSAGLRARAGRVSGSRVLETRELAGTRIEDLELLSTSGLRAHCQIRTPAPPVSAASRGSSSAGVTSSASAPRRHPAFLLAAGVETGRFAVTFPDVRDAVLLACDYPLRVPLRLEPGLLWSGLPGLRRALVDSPATLLLAIDYLSRRPEVDRDSLAVVGASFGVPAATVAAALDTRVRAAALLYGGGDLPLLFAHNVDLGSPAANRVARWLVWILGRPVEPTRYAGAIAPRRTLVVNAPLDPFIPRACAEALQVALRPPKDVRWIALDHFAAFHERDLLDELARVVTVWFRSGG